jgi:Golgi nucleoside diphosphatase
VVISDIGIGPEYFCYVPGKNWVSVDKEIINPGDTVYIRYKYTRKGDIVVTNWDGSKGNYIFYNDTILTSISSNIHKDFDFRIYPNPASTGHVVVTLNEAMQGTVHISLTDISGRLVTSETKFITKGQRTLYLDLHQIPKGVYLIRLANDRSSKTEKLIIQ